MPDESGDAKPLDRADLPRVTRLAAYAVIVRDGRVLLCRVAPGNMDAGAWTLPGGGLEFGESPATGVVREVEEETGLLVEIVGAPTIHSDTGVWARRSGRVRYHHVRFVFTARIVGGVERLEVDGSTDAIEWIPIRDASRRPLVDLVVWALDAMPDA